MDWIEVAAATAVTTTDQIFLIGLLNYLAGRRTTASGPVVMNRFNEEEEDKTISSVNIYFFEIYIAEEVRSEEKKKWAPGGTAIVAIYVSLLLTLSHLSRSVYIVLLVCIY